MKQNAEHHYACNAGTENIADYLSRCLKMNIPKVNREENVAFRLNAIQSQTELQLNKRLRECLAEESISIKQIAESTANDPVLKELLNSVKHNRKIPKSI